MRPRSRCSLAVASLFVSATALHAQADAPAGDDGKTPYNDSFTSGDVTPPPEGEPDTSEIDAVKPDQNPDDNGLNDPSSDYTADKFRIGVTSALEIPHIINVGIDSLIYQKFGVGLNYGSVTRNLSGIDVAIKHADLRFRYFPWGGSFFAGLGVGQHTLSGEKNKDITITSAAGTSLKAPTSIKLTAKANYVMPHIGWFAVWDPGFTVGLDLGWMVPSGVKTSAETSVNNTPNAADEATVRSSAEFAKSQKDLDDSVEAYAKKSQPFVTMMRVGWMF